MKEDNEWIIKFIYNFFNSFYRVRFNLKFFILKIK